MGGAWIAPATTPVPHLYSLGRPYRSCRSNQSSPDRPIIFSGKSALYMILHIHLKVTLTCPFSLVCLPRLLSLRPGFLVPASPLSWISPPSITNNLPARPAADSNPKPTQPAPSPHPRTSAFSSGLFTPFGISSTITEDHSNPLPPPAESSSVWILPRLSYHNYSNKPFTLYPIQSAIESELFDSSGWWKEQP